MLLKVEEAAPILVGSVNISRKQEAGLPKVGLYTTAKSKVTEALIRSYSSSALRVSSHRVLLKKHGVHTRDIGQGKLADLFHGTIGASQKISGI